MRNDKQTKAAFAAQLAMLSEMYGREITPAMRDVWWSAMEAVDLPDFKRAVSQHIADTDAGQWMPKPADILRKLDGTGKDRAAGAWAKVDAAVRRVGPWSRVAFDDPRIHAAVEAIGGWGQFFTTSNDEWPHLQRRFEQQYSRWLHTVPAAWPKCLTAESATAPVQYLGDARKAQLVYERGGDSGLQITDESQMNQLVSEATKALEVAK